MPPTSDREGLRSAGLYHADLEGRYTGRIDLGGFDVYTPGHITHLHSPLDKPHPTCYYYDTYPV
jgi:hypothetical protein